MKPIEIDALLSTHGKPAHALDGRRKPCPTAWVLKACTRYTRRSIMAMDTLDDRAARQAVEDWEEDQACQEWLSATDDLIKS